MTRTRAVLLALVLAPGAAVPAAAQTSDARFSLNLGAGVVFAADPRFDGAVMQLAMGTDVRLAPRWDLRVEAAGRMPALQRGLEFTTYHFENPAAPGNPRGLIRLDLPTEVSKRTLVDLSLLGRRYWIGEHAEGALLFGVDVNVARYETAIDVPRSLGDPDDVERVTTDAARAHLVFDFGTELGFRVSDRWTLFAYGIAGLQPPATDRRFWQPRAGVMLRRR